MINKFLYWLFGKRAPYTDTCYVTNPFQAREDELTAEVERLATQSHQLQRAGEQLYDSLLHLYQATMPAAKHRIDHLTYPQYRQLKAEVRRAGALLKSINKESQ